MIGYTIMDTSKKNSRFSDWLDLWVMVKKIEGVAISYGDALEAYGTARRLMREEQARKHNRELGKPR